MGNKSIANEILQRQDKDGMLRRALERIIQLYTDKSHFVYELLQNAEDAGASKIRFLQYTDRLVVLHDGHPFSLENLQGLCDIGKSDKINDLNQIGEFGVGFKSVFGICEKVQLFSHPTEDDLTEGYSRFAVEVRDFTHPVDIDDQKVEDGYTTKFIFPYKVGLPFSGFETVDKLNEVLSKRLQNLGVTTLLFMKNLQSVEYQIELPQFKKSGSYVLKKEMINEHCTLVSAIGEADSYLIFSRKVQGIQAGRTIDIAFALNVRKDGGYDFRPSIHPYISVYFPTETESKLKFIVQGPYRTTPNRSSVPADDEDNIGLAEQTSQLLKDSIIELRDNGKLDYSFLNILPIDETVFNNAPLFRNMFEAIVDMMHEERLLLCKDGTYASAECVKIARGADFAKLFTDDLLTELINDEIDYHWLPTDLTETSVQYKTLYDFLTDILKIEVIRPENLRSYFNKNRNFLLNRDDEWLVKFYHLYESVAAAFSKQKGGSNMLMAEFVKTSTGKFVAPYRRSDGNTFWLRGYENASYLPNVFLPSENIGDMGDIAFVDGYIYEQCKHFFTEILNLQKPNEYDFFIRDFKKRCEEKLSTTDEQQYIKDVKMLLKYRGNVDYRDEVERCIKKYLLLRCRKDDKVVYVNPYKEQVYFSVNSENMSIELYFSHIVVYAYVDSGFYEANGINRDLLKVLGVTENVAIREDTTNGTYSTGKPGGQPEWHTTGEFRWKLNLCYFPRILEYISKHPKEIDSMAKSSFIFRFLQNNESRLQGTVHIGGSTPDKDNEYAEIVGVLRGKLCYENYPWDGKWLYAKSGELVAQKDISKYDLNPQLYGDIKPNSKLYEILGFKKNDAELLKEAEKAYDCLSEERKNQYLEIELRRRYGISVTDLDNNFGGNSVNGSGSLPPVYQEDTYKFPSARVKNWDSLRKHVAEVLCFAKPVEYAECIRSIRVSKPENEVKAYLKSMYRTDVNKYACQMCYDSFSTVEMCQIANLPEKELDPMHLCLCPNCAVKYRQMRTNETGLRDFLTEIKNLTDVEIDNSDPVGILFADEMIYFTQTHIAEIRELMILQEEADKYEDSSEKEPAEQLK
ncbi:MAG: ATP-binding protein [Lachnospiraceae bacterium]|nr:ATP-binding protein [Lachnospiraceae bacterium]MCM1239570.1 ATP-binding protein [Lachnospiraceae bacterium]